MRRVVVTLCLIVSVLALDVVISDSAVAKTCKAKGSLKYAAAECVQKDPWPKTLPVAGPGHTYAVLPVCGSKLRRHCGKVLECTDSEGAAGHYYDVKIDGKNEGRHCITESDATEAAVVTPDLVARAFRDLTWPASTLVVQPPDGLTLVNFATNFYTTSTAPIPQTVTLLDQQVTVEATPTEYHWSFGDGETLTTTEPGAPYPELAITHDYLGVGSYAVSLATTYAGRYRVGEGGWQDIPATVTVSGEPQQLRAIEAQPKLVGY